MQSLPLPTFIGAMMALLVSMGTTNAVIAWPCPYQCECDSRLQTVRCSLVYGVRWYVTPTNIPSDVRSLHISDQNISSVTALSLSNLTNLRKLEMVRSSIRELQDNALIMAPKLRRLNLSGNSLRAMPHAVSSLRILKELILSNNFISDLNPSDFENLTKLRVLDLSINNMSILPPGLFQPLYELRRLNLSYNAIMSIDDHTFQSLTNLEDLSLSQNRIQQLSPIWMNNLQSLWILEMNGALIERSQAVHLLPVSDYIRYPNLQQIRLAGNMISDLPCDALRVMHGLQLLDLSHNKIKIIPDFCFYGMISLEELLLISNEIYLMESNSFRNVTQLSTLDLTSNRLDEIIEGLFYETSLQSLYANLNRFQALTEMTFAGAFYLRHIFLRYNQISEISHRAFLYTSYLTTVDLRDNALRRIGSEFTNLTGLTFLAFSSNLIHTVQTNAFEGTSISLIYLHNNSLTTLPQQTFSYMPTLSTITLSGNPWHCDCRVRYLCETIINSRDPYPWMEDSENMECASPKSFQEQEMQAVKPFQMICTTYASALAIQLIVGLSLSAVAISTALYVVQLYCKAKKLERNGVGDAGKCLA
ncbi:carboxypeptidase N subunit 2-like [Lytechinus variegatus]|uniref:carboxypeptidase N subunit 2-like n=1 Tax=Lytechinus variegatus TaxID=7654 RepID=UPI001BB0E2F7|nr:carboxypeptidase N subunit 2-like [Lytechinus variegatus]